MAWGRLRQEAVGSEGRPQHLAETEASLSAHRGARSSEPGCWDHGTAFSGPGSVLFAVLGLPAPSTLARTAACTCAGLWRSRTARPHPSPRLPLPLSPGWPAPTVRPMALLQAAGCSWGRLGRQALSLRGSDTASDTWGHAAGGSAVTPPPAPALQPATPPINPCASGSATWKFPGRGSARSLWVQPAACGS